MLRLTTPRSRSGSIAPAAPRSDGRRAGGCTPSAVRVGLAEQVARGLRVSGADVLDKRRVRSRDGGDPVQLAGASDLLLEVEEALEGLLVGVEGSEPSGLRVRDDAFVEVANPLSRFLVGAGIDAEGGVSLGSSLGGHGGLHMSWRFG